MSPQVPQSVIDAILRLHAKASQDQPIISPVAQTPQPSPSQAIPPTSQFSPIPESPEQAAYRQQLQQTPNRADYQAHGWRRVLNGIAGGLAGFAGHPEVGGELAQGPYQRALKDWQVKSGAAKDVADLSTERQRLGVQEGTARANVTYKSGELEAHQQRADTAQQMADIANRRADISQQRANAYENGINPLNEALNLPDTDPTKQDKIKAATEALMKIHTANKTTPDEAREIAKAHTEGVNEATLEPSGRAAAVVRPSATVSAQTTPAAIEGAAKKAAAVEEAKFKIKDTPEYVQYQQHLTAAKQAGQMSQQAKSASEKAKIALQQYPRIESEINQASDALFGDRWQDFQVGTLGKGAEEFEPLRLNVGLLQSLVAQIHVQRTGAVILQKFEGLFNAKQMDKATLKSGLNELKYWLNAYARNPNDPNLDTTVPKDVTSTGKPKLQFVEH